MNRLRSLLTCCLLVTAFLIAVQFPSLAQQQPAAPLTVPDTAKASAPQTPMPQLTPIATQLGQTLQTLVGAASAVPTPANSAIDNAEDNAAQITDTFATGVLNTLAQTVDTLKANSSNLSTNVSALPDFTEWLSHQSSDPRRQALWDDIGNDLLIVVGAPLLIGIAMTLLLMPLRLNLKRNRPSTLPGRMGLLFSLFLLRIIPVFIFLGASLLLLDQNETHRLPRFVILNVIYALSLGYVIQQILRGIFAPTAEHLRPFAMTTPQAVSTYRWFSGFNFIIVYSYFFIDVATALRIPGSSLTVFQNVFALILTVMAITVIFRTRNHVAVILQGEEEDDPQSFSRAMRIWVARHWHNLATAYLALSLIVTWLGIDNGFALMLRGTLLSIVVLAASRFGFIVIDQWRTPKPNAPTLIHRQLLSFLLRPAIWASAIVGIAAIWGVRIGKFIATPAGQRVFGAVLSIAVTLLVLTVIYEMLNASIERHLNRRDKNSKLPVASARTRTLLPMVRNSIFILFSAIAILTCLSAVGINIGPLLAGAGVVGVAIGFGSQTLVKDFLTGLFIVVENTIAVGDVVKIDSFFGNVEALSIRTIRLRDYDGALHILPFSEVSKITNMSKGFAYALVDISVAYDSDLEHVMQVLREVGTQLQEDPLFKRVIMEPIEVMGVENLGESSITVRARIRTRPGKQWDVRRLLLLRIKQRFDKENIEIPFPTVTHITKVTAQ